MSKRELIDTVSDKRYVRRNKRGQFKEVMTLGNHCRPIGWDVPTSSRSPAKARRRLDQLVGVNFEAALVE
jgi:hypothetical protein